MDSSDPCSHLMSLELNDGIFPQTFTVRVYLDNPKFHVNNKFHESFP